MSDKELAADIAADKTDRVKVVSVDLDNNVLEETQEDKSLSDSYQEEHGGNNCTSPIVEGVVRNNVVEELMVEDECDIASVLEEEGCASGLEGGLAAESQPLPVLNGSKEGVGEVIAQQLEDDSLIYARRNGEEEKDGFCFNKNGLLTHTKTSDLGKMMYCTFFILRNWYIFPSTVTYIQYIYIYIYIICDSLWEKGALHAKIEIEI